MEVKELSSNFISLQSFLRQKFAKINVEEDIFNNKLEERSSGATLYISRSMKVLTEELREGIKSFLKSNPSIKRELQKIEVDDDLAGENSLIKQMSLYFCWFNIVQNGEDAEQYLENSPQEYREIYEEDKSCEIKSIYDKVEKLSKMINSTNRSPKVNYYYSVYPEVYSFN